MVDHKIEAAAIQKAVDEGSRFTASCHGEVNLEIQNIFGCRDPYLKLGLLSLQLFFGESPGHPGRLDPFEVCPNLSDRLFHLKGDVSLEIADGELELLSF